MVINMTKLQGSPAMHFICKSLMLFGLWPLEFCDLKLPPAQKYLYKILGSFNLIICLGILFDNEILLFFIYDDIPEFTDQLAVVCSGILGITRVFSVMLQKQTYLKFLENFIGNIMMTPLNTDKENAEKYKIMQECEKISKYMVYFLFFTIMSTMTMFEFAPFISYMLLGEEMKHPFRLLVPFDVDIMISPTFEFIYFLHLICGYVCVLIIVAYDCVFNISIVYVLGQMKYLAFQVRNIVAHAKDNLTRRDIPLDEYNVDKEILRLLSKYVKKHNMLLGFCNDLNDLVSLPFLVELGGINTLIICLCGFEVIVADTTIDQTSRYFFYYVSCIATTFILCFLGHQLLNGGADFCEAIYDCEWYSGCSTNVGKSISIMLLRTQKPLTIQAGNIIDLSLETFTDLMKSSMSFFTMLQTLYE